MNKRLINFFLTVIILCASATSFAQAPLWIKIMTPVDSSSVVVTDAPLTEIELAGMLLPNPKNNLIGSQIELKCSANLMFQFSGFGNYWNSMLIATFYKYDGVFLNMNQASKQDYSMPMHMIYSVGLTTGSFMVPKPLVYTVSWKNPQTGEKEVGTITGSIRQFYAKQNFIPQVKVTSPKGKPLVRGLVRFERLGPGDHGELRADFEIKNGEVQNYTDIPLSAGHYRVSLEKPEECTKTFNENLIIFPDDNPDSEKFHFKASCEKTYDIYAYYNAPGFVKAGVVWRNNTIRFPDKDNQPQVFDVMAYERGGEQGEPKGTDGKPLKIPYSMTMPMIGKQTFYGHPENEYETPEVLYLKSLDGPNGIPAFELNKKHDALNSCHIVRINGGPIHLELGIDLNGVSGDVKMQFFITSENNIMGHMNLPAFPTNFKPIRFSTEDIEHFKKFEKVEKTISNGKATLKVKFVPHQQTNPN